VRRLPVLSAATPLLAALALFPGHALAQQMSTEPDAAWCREEWHGDRDRDRYCEVRSMTMPAGSRLAIDAKPNGGIDVEAWDRDEIQIFAKVETQARRDGDARRLADEIEVSVDSDRIDTRGPGTHARGEGWSVSYRVKVPRRMDLDLRSINGGIALRGVGGRIELRTTNGGLRLADVSGDVSGRSTNGGIHATLAGRGWEGAGLDLETTNGGVVLELPEDYSARLETGTVHGGYRIDFPVTVQGRVDARRLSVDLGDGGQTIRAITTNGGVDVRRL
jgi:hypothetical protein